MVKHIHIEIDAEFFDGDDSAIHVSIEDHECVHEEVNAPEEGMKYEQKAKITLIGEKADQRTVEYITDRLYGLY